MTNKQDVLTEIVLSKLDTMGIKEMLDIAKDLPKISKAYTPLDNAIREYILENISDMIFGRKWYLHHSIPAEFKGRKILEDAIKKKIPNLTIGKKCDLWDFNPTERTKNCLDNSIAEDISAKLKTLDIKKDFKIIHNLWYKAPNESKGEKVIEEFIEKEIPNMTFWKMCNLWKRNSIPKIKCHLEKIITEYTKEALPKMDYYEKKNFYNSLPLAIGIREFVWDSIVEQKKLSES